MTAKLKLFYWRAKNRLGQKQRGKIVAENMAQAEQMLFKRHLQNIKLQQNWQFSYQLSKTEICDLIGQLAILLQARVPLKNSLQILLQNCVNIPLNQWLNGLLKAIESGMPFSQALQQPAKFLNYQEIQLIQVGEMTGKLAQVCRQIADHKQQSLTLQRKIQKILLYPIVVLGISVILTLLLLFFIVPQFAEMYADNQANLPLFTAILLQLSNGLQRYWLVLFLISVGMVGVFRWQLRRSLWLNRQKERLISHIFLLKEIVQLARLVRFAKTMQLMLQSGVPLQQSLQSFFPSRHSWQTTMLDQQIDYQLMAEVQSILSLVQQGYPFSESVSSQLFPYQAQQMLQVGEKSGQLALMLQQIADTYQQRLDHKIDLLSQLLEPLLMVIIGGLIGLIMLGMYLPIFNMGSMV